MNIHEEQGRTLKAIKLVAAVSAFAIRYGLDVERVVRLANVSDREMFATLAHTTPPSDATWALVVRSVTDAAELTRGPEAQS